MSLISSANLKISFIYEVLAGCSYAPIYLAIFAGILAGCDALLERIVHNKQSLRTCHSHKPKRQQCTGKKQSRREEEILTNHRTSEICSNLFRLKMARHIASTQLPLYLDKNKIENYSFVSHTLLILVTYNSSFVVLRCMFAYFYYTIACQETMKINIKD